MPDPSFATLPPSSTTGTSDIKRRYIPTTRPSFAVRYGDHAYQALIFLASLSIFAIIVAIAWQLIVASMPSIRHFGFKFITHSEWDENRDIYSILPYIFGTLYSSAIALILAVPISIGSAVFLSELAPRWIRTPATFFIELLAAIPSVVYGLWAVFILIPWLLQHVMLPISNSKLPHIGVLGTLVSGTPIAGNSMLAAGIILAIMIIPYITAVTRDILRAIPRAQREGSYALGSTRWETISRVVIPYAKSGIMGAVMIGLGRALGETMAVTMVIGNQRPNTPSGISFSLFDPGYTMSSVLANKFMESVDSLNLASLVEVGLALFVITILVNTAARFLVFYTAKDLQGRK